MLSVSPLSARVYLDCNTKKRFVFFQVDTHTHTHRYYIVLSVLRADSGFEWDNAYQHKALRLSSNTKLLIWPSVAEFLLY